MKRSQFIQWIMLFALASSTLSGCAASARAEVAKSNLPRAQAPAVSQAERDELASGNLAFALELYQAVGRDPGNLFYSPYSISQALAMAYAGARGATEQQMAGTMHFTLPQDRLHPTLNALDQDMAARAAQSSQGNEPQEGDEKTGFQLKIANSIWGQQDYSFQSEFLDQLAVNYGAGLRLVDFQAAPDSARQQINAWVSDATEEKIRDLIPEGAIQNDTRLVLSNAIYFLAGWLHPFSQNRTEPAPFQLLDGSTVSVPMMGMNKSESLSYGSGPGYQVVELPYQGGEFSMLILVPDAGTFQAFEDSLDAALLEAIMGAMQITDVDLKMPKFSLEGQFSLGDTLKEMGMPAAFTPREADFSGIDGTRELYISEVIHKSFVDVDENGTEAAAATAVIIAATSAQISDPIPLVIDRPFIFLIRDNVSGTVLFIGRVMNPAQ